MRLSVGCFTRMDPKKYITDLCLLHTTDLRNSHPHFFVIKNRNIIIAHSDTTFHTWNAILKAIWNSMELKTIIFHTTFNLIEKEKICVNDDIYVRGDISLPFTMKNPNDTFKHEIMRLINMNEYTIDITIKWEEDVVHYKNF